MKLGTMTVVGLAVAVLVTPAANAQIHRRTGGRQATVTKGTSAAGQSQEAPNRKSADEAIALLARWQHGKARSKLEAAGDGGSLETAWGLLLAEEGKVDDGIVRLRAAESALSGDPAPAYWLGEVLYQFQKDLSGATAAWQEAASRAGAAMGKDAKDARSAFYAGAARIRLKRFDEARSALDVAAANGWDGAMVDYQRGLSFAFEKQWSNAVARLTDTLNTDPGYAHAWYYRALCREKLKQTSQMLTDLQQFLELAPDAPESETARDILKAAGY